jgi:hypothetical protein
MCVNGTLISSTCADNVCIESLSIDLTRPMLDTAARSVEKLTETIEECVLTSTLLPSSLAAGTDFFGNH